MGIIHPVSVCHDVAPAGDLCQFCSDRTLQHAQSGARACRRQCPRRCLLQLRPRSCSAGSRPRSRQGSAPAPCPGPPPPRRSCRYPPRPSACCWRRLPPRDPWTLCCPSPAIFRSHSSWRLGCTCMVVPAPATLDQLPYPWPRLWRVVLLRQELPLSRSSSEGVGSGQQRSAGAS